MVLVGRHQETGDRRRETDDRRRTTGESRNRVHHGEHGVRKRILHHEVHEAHEGSDKEFSHHAGAEKRGLTTKVTKSTKLKIEFQISQFKIVNLRVLRGTSCIFFLVAA